MTFEEWEKYYNEGRPIEPYCDDDSPTNWANIAHYAEENLRKAFEVGQKNCNCVHTDNSKVIERLEGENASLKEKLAEVIETFVSSSSGDDFEMAECAREIMEIMNISCYRHGKVTSKLTEAKDLLRQLIDNAPNTYSGTDICLQQKKMFTFQKAVNNTVELLKEIDR